MTRRSMIALVATVCVAGVSFATLSQAATRQAPTSSLLKQVADTSQDVLPSPRQPSTVDRYAPANGCFQVRSASGALVPGGPFLFHAFDLGKYLLVGPHNAFLSTAAQPLPMKESIDVVKGFVDGTGDEHVALVHQAGDTALDIAATV